jgi:hypothetical protein
LNSPLHVALSTCSLVTCAFHLSSTRHSFTPLAIHCSRVQSNPMNWTELNWTELNWTELNWTELNWIYNSISTELTFERNPVEVGAHNHNHNHNHTRQNGVKCGFSHPPAMVTAEHQRHRQRQSIVTPTQPTPSLHLWWLPILNGGNAVCPVRWMRQSWLHIMWTELVHFSCHASLFLPTSLLITA